MSKYKFKPRLFVIETTIEDVVKEWRVITINGCEPDDAQFFHVKGVSPSEEEGIQIAIAINQFGEYKERMVDDVLYYDIDTYGYELYPELFEDVVSGLQTYYKDHDVL